MAKIEDFLTASEAAKLLMITPQAIRRALREGRLKGIRRGKIWLIDKKNLAYAIGKNEQQ